MESGEVVQFEYKINWNKIKKILNKCSVIDINNIENLCNDLQECYEDEDGDQYYLIADLLSAITKNNDEDCCCYNLLKDQNFEWSKRLELYKIIFYKYIHLNELDRNQMINLLKSTMKSLNINIKFNEFQLAGYDCQLNGKKFNSMTDKQFANMFIECSKYSKWKSLSNINQFTWIKIYNIEINKWNLSKQNNNNNNIKKVTFSNEINHYSIDYSNDL
eukprot:169564_1